MINQQCQNCKTEFEITDDDLGFYTKIKVPPPTFCPHCRLLRRITNYGKRILYKRECNLCKKNVFSMYSKDSFAQIYCNKCWWGDEWDAMDYARAFDFNKNFFEQYKNLLNNVPWMSLGVDSPSLIDSDYCNDCDNLKNCYLIFYGSYDENSRYSDTINHSRDCMDCYMLDECEKCYQGIHLNKCYNVFFSIDCEDSVDVWFSKNLLGCSNCFGCSNLNKKSYCIFNKQYSREEYLKQVKEFNLGSNKNLIDIFQKRESSFENLPVKYLHGKHNVNVTGDYIYHSKNIKNSFEINNVEDSRFCLLLKSVASKECYDYSFFGDNATLIYESIKVGLGANNVFFSNGCWPNCRNLFYCSYCISCSNLFACIGLRNKQYCILNRQYTKEQYEELVPKIIKHMSDMPYIDKKGRTYKYGEFFPTELSPFAYNETIAQEYYPLTKEQAEEQGYRWKDKEERNYNIDIKTNDIPDDINNTDESIIGKVIECSHKDCNHQCTEAFKIIPEEYQFYKRMNLPLPRLCPNCRHYERLAQRNPLKLWHRKCMKEGCTNEFETSYAPDRPEIIYCERCYQNEVY